MDATMTDQFQKTSDTCVPCIASHLSMMPRAACLLALLAVRRAPRVPARRTRRAICFSFLLPRALRQATAAVCHYRPRVTVVVRAHHSKNGLPSPSVASSWSPLPSPPHRRSDYAVVREKSQLRPTAAMAVLTVVLAPCEQPPP